MKSDKRLDSRFQHIQEERIVLQKVTKLDTMVFQCNITNIHGYVWAEAFLNVLSEAPAIIEQPEHTKVAEGQPYYLSCFVTGKPDPIITWYRNGQQVTGGRYVISDTGSLYVKAAVLSDAGEYKCEARNAFGQVEAYASLIVRRKTVIQWKPMDLEVQRGVNAKFTCSGTTDPEETTQLTTTWVKDGLPVDIGTRMFLNTQDHSLIISGSEERDTGTYMCVISNGLDNDTAAARLVVTDIPNAPYAVTITEECVKNRTELVWIAGSFNNAPIQYFIIEYTTAIDPNRWVFAKQVDYRKAVANIALAAGMNYTFRVTSYNKIGASSPSVSPNTTCVTTVGPPTQNPRNVRTIGDITGKLHIVWTPVPPEHQGSKDFYYVITIQEDGQPQTTITSVKIPDWRTSEFIYIGKGVPYTRYKITVRSENAQGNGTESIPVIYGYSSEGAPLISPTDLNVMDIRSDNALFTWKFDRSEIGKVRSKIQGEFRGFKIQFWEQNHQAETIRDYDVSPEIALTNSTSNDFSARVPNLIPNTRLQARVSVLNNFFVSRPSDTISFVTPPGLPGPVQLLEDLNIGDNHINLQWRSPLDNRGDIIGYDIGYQEVRGLRIEELQERLPQIDDPYATTAMLGGLLPNTKYRIHIWARTIAGRGEGFFIERTTASPGVPMIPRFTITNIGTDFVNVTWWRDAYQRSGSVVYAQYRRDNGAEWFSTTPDVSREWVKIGFLMPGIRYNIRIVVTNGETTRVSQIEDFITDGTAEAYDVVANLGWLLGMIFSILLEIAIVILLAICYRRGFRFKAAGSEIQTYRDGSETYTGSRHNKEEIPRVSEDFGPEPGGFSNDIYKDGYDDGYDDDDAGKKFDDGHDEYHDDFDYGDDVSYREEHRYGYDNNGANAGANESHDYEEYHLPRGTSYTRSDHSSDTDSYRRQASKSSFDQDDFDRHPGHSRRERERETQSGGYKETRSSVRAQAEDQDHLHRREQSRHLTHPKNYPRSSQQSRRHHQYEQRDQDEFQDERQHRSARVRGQNYADVVAELRSGIAAGSGHDTSRGSAQQHSDTIV